MAPRLAREAGAAAWAYRPLGCLAGIAHLAALCGRCLCHSTRFLSYSARQECTFYAARQVSPFPLLDAPLLLHRLEPSTCCLRLHVALLPSPRPHSLLSPLSISTPSYIVFRLFSVIVTENYRITSTIRYDVVGCGTMWYENVSCFAR